MRCKIIVAMNNAAFEDAPATELGRILRGLATELEDYGPDEVVLRDSNGNRVGVARIVED